MKKLGYLLLSCIMFSCTPKEKKIEQQKIRKEAHLVTDSIAKLMEKYHYNPSELNQTSYLSLIAKAKKLITDIDSKDEFIRMYNAQWQNGPFSHVRLGELDIKAEDMAKMIDSQIMGDGSVSFDINGEVALLTVNTMTGLDTKQRITDALIQVSDKKIENLIIDLRNNTGGAFAGLPLVGHLIKDSINAGYFVSKKWWDENEKTPDLEEAADRKAWSGWSIENFWNDVEENPITKMKFGPLQPLYKGKVYVLTSSKTASAAEFVADVLSQLENVTLIGETTSGEMLSQKLYDLPYNYQIALPIAEYYSFSSGRIEGIGVEPDILINEFVAIDLANDLAMGKDLEMALSNVQEKLEKLKEEPLDGTQLFLMGNMNEWGKNINQTPQFKYVGDGAYEVAWRLTPGNYEFKIAPSNWKFDYGAKPKKETVALNKKISLIKKAGSPNLRLTIEKETNLNFTVYINEYLEGSLMVSEK